MSDQAGGSRRHRRLRLVARVACWVLLACAIVAARCWWEARQELRLGQAALAAQDREEAIRHLGRALRWYTPGSEANRQAAELLFLVGREAEDAGETVLALAAYRELRGALFAIRTLWMPHSRWLQPANRRIAALMAGQGSRNGAGEEVGFAEREAEHLALLHRDRSPDPLLSLLVVLCFLAWVAAAFAAIQWGLDEAGHVDGRRMLACLAAGLPCFALWLVAMWLA